jgi:hypothetical protein
MLIIKCLDIDPNLFFSRLDLELKISPGAFLRPLRTDPNPGSRALGAPGNRYVALLATGAAITA